MRWLGAFVVACSLCSFSWTLDRDAFTFTKYDLTIRIEPEQQRLTAEGKITLRNDSSTPQKNLALQISSTLGWRAVQFEGNPVEFLSQTYTSDIDHTGALSEAIVTLPREISAKAEIELEVRYEGVVPLNATRLTRIGVPEDVAKHTDWDQIGKDFTGLRGVGHVVWYPVAMEAANLSEGNDLFERLGSWRARGSSSKMVLHAGIATDDGSEPPIIDLGASVCSEVYESLSRAQRSSADCKFDRLSVLAPAIMAAHYNLLEKPNIRLHYFSEHQAAAETYAAASEKIAPFVNEWFGTPRTKVEVAELADSQASPFESGTMLLAPLGNGDAQLAEITLVHQLTHAAFDSPRPWIYEGLAHFAQALYLERQRGREAALDFMGLHRAAVVTSEKALARNHDPKANRDESLINTFAEELYRSKAAYVWWMLRDMVGETALKKVLASYHAGDDKETAYVQRLVEAQAHRDLEWFFDDWVYRDRGLPDFRVESVYPRPIVTGGYMVTVTVENLGAAGAEVPVVLKMKEGDVVKRIEVRAKSKNSIRFEVPSVPPEVVVNDGSVPESDLTNNSFAVGK